MKLQYHGPHEAVTIPEFDEAREIKRGEFVEVPDELGERMLEQPSNWRRPAKAAVPANP